MIKNEVNTMDSELYAEYWKIYTSYKKSLGYDQEAFNLAMEKARKVFLDSYNKK